MLIDLLREAKADKRQLLARLVDPDSQSGRPIGLDWQGYSADLVLVGGSLASSAQTKACVLQAKGQWPQKPVYLFPGGTAQLCEDADGILLLSLISGRNPDLLIGRHVEVALALKASGLDSLPTGYILVDTGRPTSVSYISNTQPIPQHKPGLAVATAVAGELLGLKAIYLEAGSGAKAPVPEEIIAAVAGRISVPLIVGGGIRSPKQVEACIAAGADMIVLGTVMESQDFASSSETP